MSESIILICILIFSVICHEYAHGWAAYHLGDPTAKLAGRLTLNPIKHIDPIGTILLPGILILLRLMGQSVFVIGWAKPVPVNFAGLNNPRRDMILVALAGPAVNLSFAFVFSRLLLLNVPINIFNLLILTIFINSLLAFFNLIPIPPLDGSRVLMGLLPRNLAIVYSRLERFGLPIVFILLYLGMFGKIVWPVMALWGKFLGVDFNGIG